MAPSANQVLDAVKSSGVRYSLCSGWNDASIDASGTWAPSYVILHHTANGGASGNAPSLNYCLKGSYPPVRNCHFLVARDGLVYVTYALKCYHAGNGGPGKWGNGVQVGQDNMNGYGYGIEIESKGTSTSTSGNNGYTEAQIDATAKLTKALLKMMGRNTGCAINHKTWAPGRKTDTLYADSWWHDKINKASGSTPPPLPPLTERIPNMAFMVRSVDNNKAYLVDSGKIVEVSGVMANNFLAPINDGVDGVTELAYFQAAEPGWSAIVKAFGPIITS